MKSRLFVSAAAAAIASHARPRPWHGERPGHRVVAAIADAQLSGLARAHVQEIARPRRKPRRGGELAGRDEVAPTAFWQKTASPWHYVTLNGVLYDHAPSEGDALEALNRFSATLRTRMRACADKQLALRFIVHLVGDLHQPLHVGKCCDTGGNEVKVKWFGRDLNLHSVWDSALVDEQQLSFTEYAAKLQRHTSNADVIAWWDINPRDWISESAQIRETVYPEASAQGAKDTKGSRCPSCPIPTSTSSRR